MPTILVKREQLYFELGQRMSNKEYIPRRFNLV